MPEEPNIMFVTLPLEVQHHIAHQHMQMEQHAHDASTFLESLTEEQLRGFRGILAAIRVGGEDASTYFIGLAGGIMSVKFGVCLACSKKHDEELAHMAGPVAEPPVAPPAEAPPEPLMPDMTEDERAILMEEYGIEEGEDGKLHCKNCMIHVASLQDRMLRKPGVDGCSGCQQKSAWG